jgi:hypothetical protein
MTSTGTGECRTMHVARIAAARNCGGDKRAGESDAEGPVPAASSRTSSARCTGTARSFLSEGRQSALR